MNQFCCDHIRDFSRASETLSRVCARAVDDIIDGRPPRDYPEQLYRDILDVAQRALEWEHEVADDIRRLEKED